MGKFILAPLGIAGASLGVGVIGEGISSISPSVGTNIQEAGATTGKFIAPAVNISAGGFVINQLRNLKKIRRL